MGQHIRWRRCGNFVFKLSDGPGPGREGMLVNDFDFSIIDRNGHGNIVCEDLAQKIVDFLNSTETPAEEERCVVEQDFTFIFRPIKDEHTVTVYRGVGEPELLPYCGTYVARADEVEDFIDNFLQSI